MNIAVKYSAQYLATLMPLRIRRISGREYNVPAGVLLPFSLNVVEQAIRNGFARQINSHEVFAHEDLFAAPYKRHLDGHGRLFDLFGGRVFDHVNPDTFVIEVGPVPPPLPPRADLVITPWTDSV